MHSEILNAISMLPGVLTAWFNIDSSDNFFKRSSIYGFMLMSLCSINYHLHKVSYRLDYNDLSHKRALFLDYASQNVTLFFTAFTTVMGSKGAVMALFAILLDYKAVFSGDASYLYYRQVRQAIIIYMLVYDNPTAIYYYLWAFAAYSVAKFFEQLRLFHAIFHLLITVGSNAIWQQSHRYYNFNSSIPSYMAEPVAIVMCILSMTYAASTFKDPVSARLLFNIVVASLYCLLNCYAFIYFFKFENIFVRYSEATGKSLPYIQARSELAYYFAFGIVEILQKDLVMSMHHIIAFVAVATAHHWGYHQLISLVLFIFTISNAPLAFGKYARHIGMPRVAKRAFIVFMLLFGLFRVMLFPFVFYYTLCKAIGKEPMTRIVTSTSCLGSLYIMQLYWFKKILHIARKMLFSDN